MTSCAPLRAGGWICFTLHDNRENTMAMDMRMKAYGMAEVVRSPGGMSQGRLQAERNAKTPGAAMAAEHHEPGCIQ